MRLPWFMHAHRGQNTLVGVLPVPTGAFVRSCADGRMEVSWYPMDGSFPGGATRVTKRLATVDATDEGERELEDAVVDFMHADPALALHLRFDQPAGVTLDWTVIGGGALATHETDHGLFFRVRHGGVATLEFLPAHGSRMRESLGNFADVCDEDTLRARIDARVRRRVTLAEDRYQAEVDRQIRRREEEAAEDERTEAARREEEARNAGSIG